MRVSRGEEDRQTILLFSCGVYFDRGKLALKNTNMKKVSTIYICNNLRKYMKSVCIDSRAETSVTIWMQAAKRNTVLLTVIIAEAFDGAKPLRTGALLYQTADIAENNEIHLNHFLEIVSSNVKGKRKRCKMALRDSCPKSGIVKPQQPALFICAPSPSQSEVHPRDGRTQMILANFPGRCGWKMRQPPMSKQGRHWEEL